MLALLLAATLQNATIGELRKENNAAIAHHDAGKLASLWAPKFILIESNGDAWTDQAALLRDYENVEFKDPGFIEYDRVPDAVTISTSGDRAAERGHWIALRRDGKPQSSGVYLASWVKGVRGWRIQWESYIALDKRAKKP